jgi:hypothetical protein
MHIEKRLCDLPKWQIQSLSDMFDNEVSQAPFKKVQEKVAKFLGVPQSQVLKLFGKYLDNDDCWISWSTILAIMQEEADTKVELRDQKLFGHKKIFLKQKKKTDLTCKKFDLFTHQYPINYIQHISFQKRSLVLLIVNHRTLVCFDEEMTEVKFQLNFNIDYGIHYGKILEQKHKVLDYESKIALNAKLRLEREASQNPKHRPKINLKKAKFDLKHENLDLELFAGIKAIGPPLGGLNGDNQKTTTDIAKGGDEDMD